MVKFGVVRGPSSDHSGLGSTPKLNVSVKVTPACAADTETEVLVAHGTPERGLPPLVGHVSLGGGRVFLQVLVVPGATDHAEVVAGGGRGTLGVVLSHALQTKEVRLLGPGFAAVDCCAVFADELQAEFIYEHVEGAKAVAGTRVGSVGIHDNVGVVRGPDEELHEEPVGPAVVASRLVQECDLVVLVHGSHVPETRGQMYESTRRQNIHAKLCEKKLGANLPGVVHHKLRRGPSRRWHTELPFTGIRTGHVRSASCRVPWGSACCLA